MKNTRTRTTILGCVVGLTFALGSHAVQAAQVVSWTLMDMDGDGLTSDFNFTSAPSGSSGNAFGATGETGCTNAANGNDCDPIDMLAGARTPVIVATPPSLDIYETHVFTAGFNFGGTGPFNPNIFGDINATIGNSYGDGRDLTFGALDFGGVFHGGGAQPGTQFFLRPDHLVNCTNQPPGSVTTNGQSLFSPGCGAIGVTTPGLNLFDDPVAPLGYNVESLVANWNGDSTKYGVVLRYIGTIGADGSACGTFCGFASNWRLEGVMTVVPVPAAVWLLGSGVLLLAGFRRKK